MDLGTARRGIHDDDWENRLAAALHLAEQGNEDDIPALRQALAAEEVMWVETALEDSIERIGRLARSRSRTSRPRRHVGARSPSTDADDASRLIHLLEPVLGEARLALQLEMPEYATSQSWRALERMRGLLDAFERLTRASGRPVVDQFAVAPFVIDLVSAEAGHAGLEPDVPSASGFQLSLDGRQNAIVTTDRELLNIILSNGTRNALEALKEVPRDRRLLAISWGETDRSSWIAIENSGAPPPGALSELGEAGLSTKEGHLGMGLALAIEAARAVSGELSLTATEVGAVFRLEWPRTA